MANQWVRLWVDMPNDPKWRTVSRISKQPISLVISVFVHLMCDAANASERGVTQCDAEDVASALDVETDQVLAVLDAMNGRVLDGKKLIGWDKRQPTREDDSRERTRAYRERRKTVTQCDAPVTQCDAPDTDTDTDTDTDKTSSVFSSSSQESISSVETKLCARRGKPLDYTDEFNEFWTQYPKRHGANAKPSAWRAWSQRVRDGCGPGSMIHGAQRYAAYCDAKGITGTEYVMQAVRFIGPDRHFENDWRKPNATGYVFDANDRPF